MALGIENTLFTQASRDFFGLRNWALVIKDRKTGNSEDTGREHP